MEYFVACIDYGRRGREAIVDPEMTRRDVVARVRSGEYRNIAFIHQIRDCTVEDVTNDVLKEAGFYDREIEPEEIDRTAAKWDHDRALRNSAEPITFEPAYP